MFPESAMISEVSIALKCQTVLRTNTFSAILSPESSRLAKFSETVKTNTSLDSFPLAFPNSQES
jgi:hypothetical protein